MYEVKENPYPMRPRERLILLGEQQLSDIELLAILLRTGTKKESALELSAHLLRHFETLSNLRRASLSELCELSGIGQVKATEMRAMIELGKRIQLAKNQREGQVLGSQEFGQRIAQEMLNLEQEHLIATYLDGQNQIIEKRTIYLDGQNQIIEKRTIFIGAVNHAPANPREILYHAIKNLAVGLLVIHNHPSGKVKPSQADKLFTNKIMSSCENLGINFVDHIIVGAGQYYSFREHC